MGAAEKVGGPHISFRPDTTDDRHENLARLVRSVRHLPGELAELGAYRGGSASVIAGSCPEKRLRLFDTWEGIPENDELEGGHLKGEFAADFEEVKRFLELYNVEYFRGDFHDTAPSAEDDTRYAFVHLDADTYQSTRAGLQYFLPASSRAACASWITTVGSDAPAWNWPSTKFARPRIYIPGRSRLGSGSDTYTALRRERDESVAHAL